MGQGTHSKASKAARKPSGGGLRPSGACAVSSATVKGESFQERFLTSTRDREGFGDQSSTGREVRESFYGRFSTTQGKQGSISRKEWGPWALFMMLVVAFDLVFGFLRPFVAEPMHVPSESMAPTLQPGDRMLTNKFVYDFVDPEKGDLVIFESIDEKKDEELVKRVVGLPGDEISVEKGALLVNSETPYEPYIAAPESSVLRKTPGVDSF
jgi:signal peptidase I